MGVFRRKSSVVHEQFGDETVIVNLESGCYYSVQGAGDAIWAYVIEGLSRSEIARRVASEYAGDRGAIVAQTSAFLDKLVEEVLVEPEEEVGEAAPSPAFEMAGRTKVFAPPMLQKYTDMEEMLQLDPIHEVDEMGWPQARKTTA